MDAFGFTACLKNSKVDYCKSGISLRTKYCEIIIPPIKKKKKRTKIPGFNWFCLYAVEDDKGDDNFELCLIEKIMQCLLVFLVFFKNCNQSVLNIQAQL